MVQHERTVGIGRRIAEIAVAPQIGTTCLRLCLFGGDRRRAGGGTRHVVDHVGTGGFDIGIPRTSREGQQRTAGKI